MHEAQGYFLHGAAVAEQCYLEMNYGGSSPSIAIFFWGGICFILSNTQLNCAVTHPLLNYSFKSYLCSISRDRNASDPDISLIFP